MSKTSLIYNLGKNITTQKLKGKNLDSVLNNISVFLINCTTTDVQNPSGSISLTSYSALGASDDPAISTKIANELTLLFGKGRTMPLSYHYPLQKPSSNTKTDWKIDKSDLQKALNFIRDGSPWPQHTFGPIELCFSYNFKLIDPITKIILSNQESESNLMVWISRSFSCSPLLHFPFISKTKDFDIYLEKIISYLPFDFKSKYLRSVTENKSKTGYIFRKL